MIDRVTALFVLAIHILLGLLASSCAARPAPAAPGFSALSRQAGEVGTTIDQARSDSKTVQTLHIDSMSLLDRLDYKAVLLLDHP